MSRRIAVHVVAGILLVGIGTSAAQESIPTPAVVAGIEGSVGVTVAIAPNLRVDDPTRNIDGRENCDRSPQTASDSRQTRAGSTRGWFAGAMRRLLEVIGAVSLSVQAGDESSH